WMSLLDSIFVFFGDSAYFYGSNLIKSYRGGLTIDWLSLVGSFMAVHGKTKPELGEFIAPWAIERLLKTNDEELVSEGLKLIQQIFKMNVSHLSSKQVISSLEHTLEIVLTQTVPDNFVSALVDFITALTETTALTPSEALWIDEV